MLALLLAASMSVADTCPLMSQFNTWVVYASDDAGCSFLRTEPCRTGVPVNFTAGAYLYSFACSVHTFTWDFGDGTETVSGLLVKHIYQTPGSYTVTLTIVNGQQTYVAKQQLVVNGRGDPPAPVPPRRRGVRH
jgi:hypothetical protein